ncbi:MAG: S4 domain-containing protein YaaA [Bacilli bacterium]|nr:S4 domain-containing protein YaaA [Bacilli bacterium]MDD3389090.1 S4 domain-containing protein YaaA [Bacilli bacterium]MDD4344729.1 S4 domain-containing protein YaaA [Bacilli bacterium]
MKNTVVAITGDYIALGQLLKKVDLISFGGDAKTYLNQHDVFVNGEKELRRGKKLYPTDTITINDQSFVIAVYAHQ